jgi:hypothetical protein
MANDAVAMVSRNADGTSAQSTRHTRVVDAGAITEADSAQGGTPTDPYVRTSGTVGFYGKTPVAQPAAIANPAGGTTVDAEARAAVNSILVALRDLGLIAP